MRRYRATAAAAPRTEHAPTTGSASDLVDGAFLAVVVPVQTLVGRRRLPG